MKRNSDRRNDVVAARQRADNARLHFFASIRATKERISPRRFRDDALIAVTEKMDDARVQATAFARQRPVFTTVVIGGLATILLWKPARAIGRTGRQISDRACQWIKQWRNSDDDDDAEKARPTEQERDNGADRYAENDS